MAYGQDGVTWVREHLKFERRLHDRDVPPLVRDLRKIGEGLRRDYDSDMEWMYQRGDRLPNRFRGKDGAWIEVQPLRVIFCGKQYPGAKVSTSPAGLTSPSTIDYFYNAESLIDHLTSLGVALEGKARWAKHTDFDRIIDWFDSNSQRKVDVDWLIANKITTVVYEGDLHINPPLRDFQFYRAVDAYTAWQELSMWLEGTLAAPQNIMIELDDKYRVMAHGFDMKYGFRTRPKDATNK